MWKKQSSVSDYGKIHALQPSGYCFIYLEA